MTNKAKNIVSDLFKLYNKEPNLLPLEWNEGLKKTKIIKQKQELYQTISLV